MTTLFAKVTHAPRRSLCIGSAGECYGGNCVHSSGCSSCARVGQGCHECICAEVVGNFRLIGRIATKLLSVARSMSAKKQAEYERRMYWVSGLVIEKCCAEKMSALGIQPGDAIESIDGKRATNARMKTMLRRSKLHTGSLVVYRQSEGRVFEIPYEVSK